MTQTDHGDIVEFSKGIVSMPDLPDLEWLRTAANDLSKLLLQIAGYSHRSQALSKNQPELRNCLEHLEENVAKASEVTRSILERVERSSNGSPSLAVRSAPALAENISRDMLDPAAVASPRSDSSAALAELARQNDVQIANLTGSRELILLVDDEAHVCLLAKLMLCDEGYKVVTAYDGEEAVRVFRCLGLHVRLVILDFIMPGIDGETVFNELQRIHPDVAVVLSSGFAEQSKLNRMLARGLCGFIAKPYSQQRLLDQVRFILDAIQNSKNSAPVPDPVRRKG
ncbi:MAG: response regulator [Verrucomicrobia bacterium]|nr:response regulator [Verrucomicrobiota bacterium]